MGFKSPVAHLCLSLRGKRVRMLTRILTLIVLSGPKFRKDRQAESLKRVVGRHTFYERKVIAMKRDGKCGKGV